MKSNFILTPTYNDWRSLNKLLLQIDRHIAGIKGNFKVIVINDASKEAYTLNIKKLKNISSVKVLNLKKNLGSQKSICIGLKYLQKIKKNSIITIIDSDGEDDPSKIKKIIKLSNQNPEAIITVNRLDRTENFFFKSLNNLRLIFTYLLTGKYINFGNYSSFHSQNLKKMLSNSKLWLAYSAGVSKNCIKLKSFHAKKNKRYFGKSKVNLFFLFKHSIKIIYVFKKELFIRALFLIFLSRFFMPVITNFLIVILILFTILLFFYNLKNNNEFKNCLNLIYNKKIIKD